MSSSSEALSTATVVRHSDDAVAVGVPELRTGIWTRLGSTAVLGDRTTEDSLSALAERTRDAARAQGYAVGWAQGRRDADAAARDEASERAATAAADQERREAEHRAAVDALELAAARLHEIVAQTCARVEDATVALALELTTELVGREVALAADPGADAIARAVALLPTTGAARVRLHPADVASDAVAVLAERGVAVDADPSLARGDAVVEGEDHVIDLRIGTALDRVREVLR